MRFEEFKLSTPLMEAISYMGFEEATPIQEKAIPEIIKKKDIIACAQTGTGKTAAFVLPVLHHLTGETANDVHTLIIVPTRELAVQIDQQIQGLSYFLDVNSLAIYGGGDGTEWGNQKTALLGGANIIVATPGKLISHLNMGYVKFDKVRHLVLDEADRMLDMNFYDDIKKIAGHLTGLEHTSMFSATMSPKIRKLAKELLKDPVEISFAVSKPAENVRQSCYHVSENQKTSLAIQLITDRKDFPRILVFTSTKKKVGDITRGLKKAGFNVESISSDLNQREREEVLIRFRSGRTRVLVATDVLSRGIDIKDISLIINYDVPGEPEDYVHRIGRTARAKNEGEAITFITKEDNFKLNRIEKLIEAKVPVMQLPDTISKDHAPVGHTNNRKRKPFRHKRTRKSPGSQ